MSNYLLFKQIHVWVTLLCFVTGLFWLYWQPLYAQEPTLDVAVNGERYPEIEITARCQGLGAGANTLFLEIYENNQRQLRSLVTVEAAAPKRILLFLDISVYGKVALQQIADALYQFNDLCTWGKEDQLAVYVTNVKGGTCEVVGLVHWTNDRIAAANRVRQFADAIVNPQAFVDSDLYPLVTALPRGNTPLYELTQQAVKKVLDPFTPEPTHGVLVVFSDGVDDWQKRDRFVELGKEIRKTYDLFTVFLADAEMKQPKNLLALVDAHTNHTSYFALGSSTSLTLTDLWRQLENPQTYKFTYITQSPSPITLVVEAQADKQPPVRVQRSLSVELQPVQLSIIAPPLGAVFAVTRTNNISTAMIFTETIDAQVAVIWPAGRVPRSARLYYQLNGQPQQVHTFDPSLMPRQIISLPLKALAVGSYELAVTVDGDHPTLHSADKSFFEIREKDLIPIQQNETQIQLVDQRVSRQSIFYVSLLGGALGVGLLLLWWLSSESERNRRQAEERDDQLEKRLARLQLEQKSLAGSIVPMTAANWRLEQPKLKAALFLLQGGGVPEFIPILADEESSITTLGSGDRNTIRLWHRYIDDQHCLIRYENNKCFIRDGGQEQERSTNGTFVNHDPVGWEERRLADGDQIQLGLSVRYSFRTKRADDALPADAPKPETAPTPVMLLTLADPPTVVTQPPPRQNA